MKIEHLALNVPDAPAMADWYVENLGFKIALAGTESPFVRFIADDNGCMLELYQNDAAPVFDYPSVHHLSLHLAFESEDPRAESERLTAKGASFVEEISSPAGDVLVMMKDPWGVAIQFCKRTKKLV